MVDRLTRADGGYGSSASSPQLWRCAALAIATLVSLTTTPPNGQAATILAADREWSEVEGWTVYWNTQNESCFAERAQPDGTQVLVGMLGKDNRLALGFRNNTLSFAKKDKTFKLKLRFDGRSSWDSGMVLYDFGSGPLLLGTYDGAVKFRADIAKSSKLTIQLGKKSLAAISLKGTNAVFKAVDQCRLVKGEKADKTTEVVDAEAEAEAGKLNNDAADLYDAGNYSEAEPLYRRSLAIREKVLRPEHPDIGQSLNNLAVLLRDKGDLAGAEQLHRRALTIREKALGPEHPDVGESLDNLAILLATKGDISGAEPLFRRALTNRENALGPEHPDVGSSLSDLAGLLWTKGDFAEAEPLLRRALAIFEMALGPEHRQVGTALHNLATLLGSSGDPAEAEPLFRRALAIREKVLGQDHVDVGESLNNLANLLRDMGDIAEAEKLYRRALGIDEKALGQEHANVATDINNLAILLEIKGDIAGSLSMARRAAKAGHPSRSILLGSLYAATTQPNSVTPESFVAVQRTAASETGSAVNSLALRGLVSAGQLSVQVRDEQDLTAKLSKLEGAILAEVSKEPAQRVKVIEELIRSQTTKVNAELGRRLIKAKPQSDGSEFGESQIG